MDGRRVAGQVVADVDTWAGVLLVLDLGVCEGGPVVDAPVHRPQAAVDESAFEEAVEGLQGSCFVTLGHGRVGVIPAPKDAQTDELAGLQVYIFLGVFAAVAQKLRRRHVQLFAAKLFVDLDFDGKAVAVEAGDVG